MANYGLVYSINILYHTAKFLSIYRGKNALENAPSHKEVKSHHENIVMAFIILSYFNKAIVSEISRYNCSLLSRVYEISSSGSSKSNEMLNSLG